MLDRHAGAEPALQAAAGLRVSSSSQHSDRKVHREFDKAEAQAREQQHAERQAAEPEGADAVGDELDEDLDAAA